MKPTVVFAALLLVLSLDVAVAQRTPKIEILADTLADGGHPIFSPDGRLLLTYGDTPMLWDVATGRLIRRFLGHQAGITGAAFSHDGRLLVTGSHDKTLKLWDVATGQFVRTVAKLPGPVFGMSYS